MVPQGRLHVRHLLFQCTTHRQQATEFVGIAKHPYVDRFHHVVERPFGTFGCDPNRGVDGDGKVAQGAVVHRQ